jgi:hypothetical protein
MHIAIRAIGTDCIRPGKRVEIRWVFKGRIAGACATHIVDAHITQRSILQVGASEINVIKRCS